MTRRNDASIPFSLSNIMTMNLGYWCWGQKREGPKSKGWVPNLWILWRLGENPVIWTYDDRRSESTSLKVTVEWWLIIDTTRSMYRKSKKVMDERRWNENWIMKYCNLAKEESTRWTIRVPVKLLKSCDARGRKSTR